MLNFGMKRQPRRKVMAAQDRNDQQRPRPGQAPQQGRQMPQDYQSLHPQSDACEWWTPEMDDAFAEAADLAGLDPRQEEQLKAIFVQTICQAEADEAQELEQAKQQALTMLERTWGQDADRQFAAANQAASALNMDEAALEGLLKSQNAPQIFEALAKLGDAMAEDGALPLSQQSRPGGRANAQQDLERLNADKDHLAAYLNRDHPGHAAAKRQRKGLIDMTLTQQR